MIGTKKIEESIACDHCKAKMTKKGIMDSGNSRFNIFECTACGKQKWVAVGVNH